ncbi:N-acyl-D-amino-acid deacylase family protein [Kineococcus radiotolerans]|uniref:N-acyl-D-amino-acid deacylase n=1 Tax=Kineococcus radiotolerans (strain ATCC BAA-149 / DSM 14245 / SRS30216) TaxID=266940 RepID=A6W6T1_KINRD|nr:D-aminoacylase [Kineococcus radiotolerans]ABS02520.1 N-acyl-D-amino-acid deacylase [Kineococcus radiotolerans SRS30216 = ATCC BAA-149]
MRSARDLLIRGARIVDGTGAAGYRGDALVVDGRIAELGEVAGAAGARVLDAAGLVLAPGFVDMHAHSDLAVLTDPEHLAKTTQGVTTEVVGQDGLSYAPVDDAALDVLREQLAGWNGVPDLDWDWRGVGEYLDRVDRGAAVNVAYLVPQGTVRMVVVGTEDRAATPEELRRMRSLVATGMAEGAFGMSSGLTYVPGMYAGTDELVALCEVVAAHGGFYAPHQRSYGRGALEAYAEVVEVARRSGVALHLTHATMNFAVNAGRAGEFLGLVDAALADGVDVTLDTYPYLPGSTTLAAVLPSWASAGGPAETLRRLGDPAARERVRHALEVEGSDGCHGVVADWATLQVSGVRHGELSGLVGSTVAELAAASGRDPFDVFVDVLVRDRLGTTVLQHVGHEENVRAIMTHPRHTGGSDGLLVGGRPHPRAWGTFPYYLGHYVREEGVLGLEECVAHLTSRPARRLGLGDRGVLRPGAVADLVLFDPGTVAAGATFEEPRRPAVGIPHVLVGGVPVVADGVRTGAVPGRALRHRHPGHPLPFRAIAIYR